MIDSQAPCWSCPPPGCPCPGPCRLSPGSWRPGGPPPSPPPAAGSAGACAAALSPVCPKKQTGNIFLVKQKLFLRNQIFLFLNVEIFSGNSNIFIVRFCHLQVCVLIVVHGPPLHHRLLHQMLPERQYRVPVIIIILSSLSSSSLSLTSEISQEGCAAGSA